MKSVKEVHNSIEHRQRKRHVSAGLQPIAMFPWEACRIAFNITRSQSQCESALYIEPNKMGSKECEGP